AKAQLDSAAWEAGLTKAKNEMHQLAGKDAQEYVQTGRSLENLAVTNPGNAEVWYFLGNAIDKFNTSSGEQLPSSTLALAQKASDCFVNATELSDNHYQGDILLLDPHSKILSVWGAQAERYLFQKNKDSAVWCMQQAKKYGGINGSVSAYFKQVLDECTDSAYLFTNGDLYFYYISYLQLVENYKPAVHCISLNFLNTSWYPDYLQKKGSLDLPFSGNDLAKIKSKKWKADKLTIENKANLPGVDSAISWAMKPKDGEYMLRSEIILRAFMQNNGFRKDIYFAADVPEKMRLFLSVNNYAELRGLTLKIVPYWKSTSLPYLENRLSMLNELSHEDDADFTYNKDNIQVLNNYRFAYTAAADLAMNQNQMKAAENILLFEEKKYPETLLPFFADATRKCFDGFKEKILMTAANN
ncbi:MAG: hypothetical protein ACRDE7_07715, partial [Sphingobacterium sp.]